MFCNADMEIQDTFCKAHSIKTVLKYSCEHNKSQTSLIMEKCLKPRIRQADTPWAADV